LWSSGQGNVAEAILYEALDAAEPVLSSVLSREPNKFAVSFVVVGFSPISLVDPPRPSAAVANALGIHKNAPKTSLATSTTNSHYSAREVDEEEVSRLAIHHIYHERDPLDKSMGLLKFAETRAQLAHRSLKSSFFDDAYTLLADTLNASGPPDDIYEILKGRLIHEMKELAAATSEAIDTRVLSRDIDAQSLAKVDMLLWKTNSNIKRTILASDRYLTTSTRWVYHDKYCTELTEGTFMYVQEDYQLRNPWLTFVLVATSLWRVLWKLAYVSRALPRVS
jgi:hypothetical protein